VDVSGLCPVPSVAGALTVVGRSGVLGPFWLRTSDTVLGTDRMPPGVIDAATATTVRKTTAVKSTPFRPLGTNPTGPRRSFVAQRAFRA
jgi:hypothetical protein